MDTERSLLFGVVAFQSGAVEADRLAETCAAWATEPTMPLADLLVGRGLITDEQRTEVEKAVEQELETYGGDPQATLAATMDGRSLEAIGPIADPVGKIEARLNPPQAQGGHVVLGTLSGEAESRERYTLTHLHAKGGMGRVWLARDGALGRQIALKELRPDQSDNSIVCSRFLYEARITAQLEHPGIVPVYELGEGDAPYYTMRFVRGRTLSEAIRAYHKKRAAGEADSVEMVGLLSAFVGVCHAVAYAHSRGIIHRDIKGQNVVLGDFGEVIVLDWGLAKRVGPDQQDGAVPQAIIANPAAPELPTALTRAAASEPDDGCTLAASDDDDYTIPGSKAVDSGRAPSPGPNSGSVPGPNRGAHHHSNGSSNGGAHHHSNGSSKIGPRHGPESGAGPEGTMQGQLLGTPAYMAPEQAQGRHDLVDQRTDVYGLGAILFEILTGRPPFIAPKTSEVIRKVCEEAPTPPRQILATIAPGLEAVCLKALQKQKDQRYASAGELAQEVQRWLADEPVRAYPEPLTRRALRWARRHKIAVSAAAGLLVAATLALSISTVLIAQEKKEAETQGQQARQAVNLLTKVADIGFDEQLDPLQQEFLENALAYYEKFTGRSSHDPGVRLEHGRAYQQMGDIQRKLGKLKESEAAYTNAIGILEPLAATGHDPKRALARTRTLLADLLVRLGADKGKAGTLYSQALEVQQALADAPAAIAEDRLRLGQTLKSQADLMRLEGRLPQAKAVYDRAISVLEKTRAADPKPAEIRNELGWAVDARGWIHRELGELKQAEDDYRRAVELLEALVAEFPTVPRHREALARAYNSLGLIEESTGRLADAETDLRRELPLVDRLAQDFPGRPEHSRELARTLNNLGDILLALDRTGEAEPFFRRAVEVNTAIAAKSPDDMQIRLDLAKDYNNLGELLRGKWESDQASAAFLKARSINEGLVKQFPDKPRYREALASNLANLALVQQLSDPPKAEETNGAALAIFEKLIADHPDNVGYRLGQARCLQNLSLIVAAAGRPERAETLYRRALALLQTEDAKASSPESLRLQASVLSNLGELRRPGSEQAFRRSIEISEGLVARQSSDRNDRHNLAIARNNLGDLLIKAKRLPEAEPYLVKAVAGLEELAAEAPKAIDLQGHLGAVLSTKADWLEGVDKLAEAKAVRENAVARVRQAVLLSKNAPAYRHSLGEETVALAKVDLKLGAYEDAARLALDIPKIVPGSERPRACFDAARILARLVSQVGADGKLSQADRDRLTRGSVGRAIVLLREAIDASPELAEQIKTDADIRRLESRPEFQTMMNTLVKLGG